MGLGIDIGIDAHGDGRPGAETQRDAVEKLELLFGFDVEAGNRLL